MTNAMRLTQEQINELKLMLQAPGLAFSGSPVPALERAFAIGYTAGRRAGMEECEMLCAAMDNGPRGFPATSPDCAAAIRALAKEEG